jgi:hypothetical protein
VCLELNELRRSQPSRRLLALFYVLLKSRPIGPDAPRRAIDPRAPRGGHSRSGIRDERRLLFRVA